MRLLTRSDFDGLACAAILKELGVIDCWKFVHPKDIQDGMIDVTGDDVLANIPYAEGCGLWFDHHSSENARLGVGIKYEGASYHAPSCARVVYDYYGGYERLPQFAEMVSGADKVDAGSLTRDEIVDPSGWILLGFIMDPRTGLGRFRAFTISNYALMEKLIDACRTMQIEEILKMPDVVERIALYREQSDKFKQMVLEHSRIHQDVVITDLRGVETIYTGNRFLLYCLFPDQNISIWVVDGRAKQNCVVAVGYSVINRTATVDVGRLLLQYGGGGHRMVGTCQVPYDQADQVLRELTETIHSTSDDEMPSADEIDEILKELDL
ncbi:MAG: exopolyphosphatase [Clostridiales bacterium]|jgi:nanoRNase/pAp phosphatase (c-di-AMP/oligoRNAs hydrolase)|nr:exopolyphosphatase [Clostridiales bacterium]